MSTGDPNGKESLASHYALQVALQTMKERCQNLQHRLTNVEDENIRLRMVAGMDKPDQQVIERNDMSASQYGGQNEIELLRDKVAELTRQKLQLTEHIAMVATENRQLWSRLSKLTKDNHTLGNSLNKMKDSLSGVTSNAATTPLSVSSNLVRSKTFTQNNPNPMIRPTINPSDFDDDESNDRYNDKHDEYSSLENTIGFGYLPDQDVTDEQQPEVNAKRINESLKDFKKAMLLQQNDLKNILTKMQLHKMSAEKAKTSTDLLNKIIKVDKCLETDPVVDETIELSSKEADDEMNLLKEAVLKEDIDKMCPMCGEQFSKQASFHEFQEHVEFHFVDDGGNDFNSIEQNFEIIQHTVGDF